MLILGYFKTDKIIFKLKYKINGRSKSYSRYKDMLIWGISS